MERLLKTKASSAPGPRSTRRSGGAQLFLDIEEKEPGGFTELIWKHVGGKPQQNAFRSMKQVPAKTKMSEALSKELKSAASISSAPVIVYAFAQAVGMVNDHMTDCFRHAECAKLAKKIKR